MSQPQNIWFEIPFNGVYIKNNSLRRVLLQLPFRDWFKHNNVSLQGNEEMLCFIRNPFDRVILHYEFQRQNRKALMQYPMEFGEWVHKCFNPERIDKFIQNNPKEMLSQKAWLEGSEGMVKTEVLGDDAEDVKNHPHIRSIDSVNRDQYYTNELAEIVLRWYRDDFDYFNFDTNWQN